MGRRSRRREHEEAAPPPEPRRPKRRPRPEGARGSAGTEPRKPSRSEAKDATARAALVPLREGERPGAVTVAAIVAALLALANVIWYAAGAEIDGRRPAASGVLSYSVLMGVAAWGMWRAKYWAVLGMQAVLVIAMMLLSLLVLKASDVLTVLICAAIIVPSGFLFWFLVKALARIQMPDRRPR